MSCGHRQSELGIVRRKVHTQIIPLRTNSWCFLRPILCHRLSRLTRSLCPCSPRNILEMGSCASVPAKGACELRHLALKHARFSTLLVACVWRVVCSGPPHNDEGCAITRCKLVEDHTANFEEAWVRTGQRARPRRFGRGLRWRAHRRQNAVSFRDFRRNYAQDHAILRITNCAILQLRVQGDAA